MNLNCLGDVGHLYEKAENAVKQYERVAFEERAEVLDYLREASHAIWKVLNAPKDSDEMQDFLKVAKESCRKAIIATREGVIAYLMIEVDSFWHHKFLKTELERFYPNYTDVFERCREIRERWHNDAGRHAIPLEQMDRDFEELKRIRAEMDNVFPELFAMQYERKKSSCERQQARYDKIRNIKRRNVRCEYIKGAVMDWLAIALSIFGILLTIVQEQHHRLDMVLMLCFVAIGLVACKKFCKKFWMCCCWA